MSDLFTFTSTGLDQETFRILRFSGTEAVSECYNFDLELLALKEFDIQTLYDTDAVFTVSRQDGTSTSYRGRVASISVEKVMSGDYFKCRARLVPHLWFYTLRKSSKAYVGKTITDIIDNELKENGEGASGGFTAQYDLLPQKPFPLVIKYHETPLEFVSRLLQRECLYYYFLAEGGMDTLKFSSDSKLSSNEVLSAKVVNEQAFSALGVDDERILHKSAQMSQARRSEPVNLYAFDGNPDSVETMHGIGRTAIEKNMLGPLRDISNIRQSQDGRASLRYTVATSVRGMRVGIVYDGLRALSLRHDGDQSSTVLESLGLPTDSTQQDFYRNQGTWMPEGEAYIPELTLEAPRIANATLTGFTTRINANGTYDVLCHSIDAETDLPNVRMMFPFAGQKGNASGMHLPLVDGTEVLLEFLEGDPDRPVILGSLYNVSVDSPVTVVNKDTHIVETPQGQKVYLIDGDTNTTHIEAQSRIVNISNTEIIDVDSNIQGPFIKLHSSKLIELHADIDTQLVLNGTANLVNLQAGAIVAIDLDLGGVDINIKASGTYININGNSDIILLQTNNSTKIDINGTSQTIIIDTGAGQVINITQAGDKITINNSVNAHIHLEANKVTINDGCGQFIELVNGATTTANFNVTDLTFANTTLIFADTTLTCGKLDITADDINITEKNHSCITTGATASMHIGATANAFIGAAAELFAGAKASLTAGLMLDIVLGFCCSIDLAGHCDIAPFKQDTKAVNNYLTVVNNYNMVNNISLSVTQNIVNVTEVELNVNHTHVTAISLLV